MGLFSSKVKRSFPELARESVDDTVARLLREAQEVQGQGPPAPAAAPEVALEPKAGLRYRVVEGLSFDADGRWRITIRLSLDTRLAEGRMNEQPAVAVHG